MKAFFCNRATRGVLSNSTDPQNRLLFSSSFITSAVRFLLIVAFLVVVMRVVARALFAPTSGWADMWLAPTFYLWNGYDIYGAHGEPALAILYGPVMSLAYSPAIFGTTPLAAIWIAAGTAVLYGVVAVLAPVAWLARSSFFKKNTLAWAAAVVLLMAALLIGSTSTLFDIRPESPAVALLVLAALVTAFPFRGSLWLAAGFCMMAGGAQFLYLIGAGGIFCYLFQTAGRKQAFKFVVCMMVTGIIALALVHWKYGLAEIYEATIRNASVHPFVWHSELGRTKTMEGSSIVIKLACAARVFQLLMLHLLPLFLLMVIFRVSTPDSSSQERSTGDRWLLLCGWMTAALLPVSVMGLAKFGGTSNTLAPTMLFLMQMVLVLGINWYQRHGRSMAVQCAVMMGLTISCSCLAVQSAALGYRADYHIYDHLEKLLKKYPQEVWLPSRPLAHWFFEKRVIHSGDVLFCHHLGGTELPPPWLSAHWPEKMAFTAWYKYDPTPYLQDVRELTKAYGNVMAEEKKPGDYGLPDDGSFVVFGPPLSDQP